MGQNSHLLMSRLKQESLPLHARLENIPFIVALSNGKLPLASYVSQLRAFASLFGTLERVFSYINQFIESGTVYQTLLLETVSIMEPSVCTAMGIEERRFVYLTRDLDCFERLLFPEIIEVRHHTDTMAARIRFLAGEDPVSLMGYIYVLQGTMLGNRVHMPDVQQTFGINESNGARFYSGYGDRTDEYWAIYSGLMNSFDIDDKTADRVLNGTREAFDFLEKIHGALFPLPSTEGMRFSASSINSEAANHTVPVDKREIVAAITSGRLCREEFPYLDERYGERGKRFGNSDSAWLATLSELPTTLIISKIAWCGDLLAVRGMPRIILECQLRHLYNELGKALPEKQATYGRLLEAMEWLKGERLKHIQEKQFGALCHTFSERTANELGGKLRGTGSLIVSAVCDEKAKIRADTSRSIETWLTDSQRFDATWITSVRETFAQARSIAV